VPKVPDGSNTFCGSERARKRKHHILKAKERTVNPTAKLIGGTECD